MICEPKSVRFNADTLSNPSLWNREEEWSFTLNFWVKHWINHPLGKINKMHQSHSIFTSPKQKNPHCAWKLFEHSLYNNLTTIFKGRHPGDSWNWPVYCLPNPGPHYHCPARTGRWPGALLVDITSLWMQEAQWRQSWTLANNLIFSNILSVAVFMSYF